MVPGTETLSVLARDRFGAELPDVGARLGTAQRIREVLDGAGFQDIQVGDFKGQHGGIAPASLSRHQLQLKKSMW